METPKDTLPLSPTPEPTTPIEPNEPNEPNEPTMSTAPAPPAPRRTLDDLRQRMRQRHPDRTYDNDDDLYADLLDDLDADDQQRQVLEDDNALYRQRDQSLTDLFINNPSAADWFMSISDGKSPLQGLVESLGTDAILEKLKSPDAAKELAAAQQQYLDSVKKDNDFRRQYEENVVNSLKADDDAVQSGTLTEDDIDRAHESLEKKVNNYILGLWTTDDLISELHALNHDTDVADAEHLGEVRGRNQQITDKLRSRQQGGDGLPRGGSGASQPQRNHAPATSIFGIASLART